MNLNEISLCLFLCISCLHLLLWIWTKYPLSCLFPCSTFLRRVRKSNIQKSNQKGTNNQSSSATAATSSDSKQKQSNNHNNNNNNNTVSNRKSNNSNNNHNNNNHHPKQGANRTKNLLKFENDYDFEQANNKFEELRSQLSKLKVGEEVKPEQVLFFVFLTYYLRSTHPHTLVIELNK